MWAALRKFTDKRKAPRFDVSLTAQIIVDGHPIPADTVNISLTGVYLCLAESCRDFKNDEKYRVEFLLQSSAKPIIVTARIVTVSHKSDDKCYLTMEFDFVHAEDKDRLNALMRIIENPIEKRNELRLLSCVEARIWINRVPVEAYSKDISASGIRLQFQSSARFTQGESYQVEIDLPGARGTIVTNCKVVRVDRQDIRSDVRLVALHFSDIPNQDQHLIRKFVEQREDQRRSMGIR